MIGGALDCFEFFRLRTLFIDLFQEWRELGEAKIFPVSLFPAEQAEHIGVLHHEYRILIGNGGIKQDIGEPLHCASPLAAFETELLFAMNDQERIARDGVQRFDPASDEHRDFPKAAEIEIVRRRFRWHPVGEDQRLEAIDPAEILHDDKCRDHRDLARDHQRGKQGHEDQVAAPEA